MTNRYRFDAENHVHLLDGRPLVGTSRVGSVLAKPLTWWASGLAVQTFGCPDPKVLTKIKNRKATKEEIETHRNGLSQFLTTLREFTPEQYEVLIDKAYRAHQTTLKDKAATGTDIHAECERYIKARIAGSGDSATDYSPQIMPFVKWSYENTKRWLWSEGHCYSEKHWIGGICDAGYEKLDGTFGILDFKSTKEAYVPQFWQCAGYDIQISENGVLDKDGNEIIRFCPWNASEYCIFAFGGETPKPYFFSDPKGAKEAFLATLLIYNKLPQE